MAGLFDDLYGSSPSSKGLFDDLYDDPSDEEEKEEPTWFERYIEAPARELAARVVDLPTTAVDAADFLSRLSPIGAAARLHPGHRAAHEERIARARAFVSPATDLAEDIRADFPAETFGEKAARAVGGAAPDLAAAVALGPAGALIYGGAVAGGASLKEAEARGVDPLEAELKAVLSAAGGGILERLGAKPVRELLKRVPPAERRSLIDRTLRSMAIEGTTEISQETLDTALEAATGADVGGAGDVLERLAISGVAGSTLAGGAGGARAIADLSRPLDPTGGVSEVTKRYLTTRKGLPEEFFQARERQEQEHEANIFLAKERSQRLRTVHEKLAAGDTTKLQEIQRRHNDWLDAPYEEKAAIQIEPEAAPILQEMRTAADRMTRQILGHPGWTTERQREVLVGNQGRYHYRSYDIHDDAQQRLAVVAPHLVEAGRGWKPSEAWLAAREVLRKDNPEASTEALDKELRALFDIDNQVVAEQSMWASLGGVIPGINRAPMYSRTMDLHPELRALFGEQFDPVVRHMKTVQNVSRMITTREMYDAFLHNGFGADLFTKDLEDGSPNTFISLRQRAEQGSTVAKELLRSQPLSNGQEQAILAGVPKELGKVERWQLVSDIHADVNLMAAFDLATNQMSWRQLASGGDLAVQAMAGAAMAAQGAKAGNTVFRIQTQARNILSNSLDVLANGGMVPGRWNFTKTAIDTPNMLEAYFSAPGVAATAAGLHESLPYKPTKKRIRQAAERLRQGVADKSIDVGDLDYFFGQHLAGAENFTATRRALTYPFRVARGFYKWGDGVAKSVVYGTEQRKMAWAFDQELRDGKLTADDIKNIAAETVKSNAQNYDRQPEAVQAIRKIPVIGPYVAFPAAATINLKNTARSALGELGFEGAIVSGSPFQQALIEAGPQAKRRLKEVGLHRLGSTGLALTAGMTSAVVLKQVAEQMFTGLAAELGGEAMPELDEEGWSDLIWSAPFWMQSSELIPVYRNRQGQVYVLDFSQGDYFNNLKRPLIAGLRAGEIDENAWGAALRELVEPYLAMDVLTGAVGAVLFNRDRYGGEIYSPTESPLPLSEDFTWNAFSKSLEHVTLATLGQAKDVIKLYDAVQGKGRSGGDARNFDIATELGAWAGVRPVIIDFEKNFINLIYATSSDLRVLTQKLNDVVRAKGEVPTEAKRKAFAAAEEAVLLRYQRLVKAKEVALRQGVPEELVDFHIGAHRLGRRERALLHGTLTAEEAAELWRKRQRANTEKERAKRLNHALSRFDIKNPRATPQERRAEEERLSRLWGPL